MRKWKHLFLLITCVVCLIFMFGCKEKEGKNEVEETLENNIVITGSSEKYTPDNAYTNNDVDYTIKTKSILTNNININYPQIMGLSNRKLQMNWNNIIKDKVEAEMNNVGSNDKFFLTYEVKTQNEDMISILIIGEISCSANGNESRMFKYTFNIDLETGKGIRLKDKVDTDKIARNLLEGRKYSLRDVDNSQFREYMNLFYKDKKEVVDTLNEFDFGENMAYTCGYSYFENGKIYICLGVNHQLGDYIEILIDN